MAAMPDAIPRVNHGTMQRYIEKKVIIALQVLRVENGQVMAQTSDKGQVIVMASGANPFDSTFVEVVGTVISPNTIQEDDHINLSDNFNLDLYNELVKLSHEQYRDMFMA